MKWSRWYMYVIPGGIVGTIALIGISVALSFLFPDLSGVSTTPDFEPKEKGIVCDPIEPTNPEKIPDRCWFENNEGEKITYQEWRDEKGDD